MQLDRYTEAADAFANFLTVTPGVLDAFINERRGDALTAAGDNRAALSAYTNAVQSPRLATNFLLELKLAQTYVLVGDYTTAQVVYEDIYTRTDSQHIKAQVDYALGQMYANNGQDEQATAAYLDAVLNYPQAYYSYLSLVELVDAGYPIDDLQRGLVDYYAGQDGVAISAFDRYLSSGPSDPSTALYYEGLILRNQDDLSGAISLWDKVIAGDPAGQDWDSAWEQKAYTQWAYQGDYAAGEKTLLDFVAAAPTHLALPNSSSMPLVWQSGMIAYWMLQRSGNAFQANTRIPILSSGLSSCLRYATTAWEIMLQLKQCSSRLKPSPPLQSIEPRRTFGPANLRLRKVIPPPRRPPGSKLLP